MKHLIVSLFILITISFGGVLVDGYAYLEDQTDHSGIMILFQGTVSFEPPDTNYTNTDGYYSMEIDTGLYNFIFSKEEYLNVELVGQQVYSDTTLETVTLVAFVNISGYVLLENQEDLEGETDYSGVQIAFERTSISVLLDTVYTESSGYFSINIQAGVYDINYYKEGFVKWEYAVVIALAFVVGGYFGSKLAISLPDQTVRKVFGVIMLIGALKLIFSK